MAEVKIRALSPTDVPAITVVNTSIKDKLILPQINEIRHLSYEDVTPLKIIKKAGYTKIIHVSSDKLIKIIPDATISLKSVRRLQIPSFKRVGRGKIRIYEVAKTLKLDTKRIMEEARRLGADVSVPSNSISVKIADAILDKYYPQDEPDKKEIQLNEDEFFAFALFDNQIKLVSLKKDGTYNFVDKTQNLHNLLYTISSESKAMALAIEELEYLMNNPKSKENDFQIFFERNPNFILSDEYKKAHPHIILAEESKDSLIPDFFLEPINQNHLCDILELKLPKAKVFVEKERRKRFSSAVYEVVAQLREYSSYFDEKSNRERIKQAYGLLAYRPKLFVIIGRRGSVSPIEVRKIETDFPQLNLRTYDDILDKMKSKIR